MAFKGKMVAPIRKLASRNSLAFRTHLSRKLHKDKQNSSKLLASVTYNASNMGTGFIA